MSLVTRLGLRDFLVDEFVDLELNFFAPEEQLFLNSNILTGSDEVYTETPFSIEEKLANSVPRDAIMYITIPSQIEIRSISDVENSCAGAVNLQSGLTCKLEVLPNDEGLKMTVTDAFMPNGLNP